MPVRNLSLITFAVVLVSAALGDPVKPLWPEAFSAPFGLYVAFPSVKNATSHFYYDWGNRSTLIDYPQHCINAIPLLSPSHPCKIYFNANGSYLSIPALGKQCCTLFAGVGPVPPAFLAGFNYTGTQDAKDYYGNNHHCNYWSDSTGFGYWTDIQTDLDIYFRDGPTGTYWAWGDLTEGPQNQSLFELPGTPEQCATTCFKLEEETNAVLAAEPMLKLAVAHAARNRRGL
eukprot:c13069_g1_i1.p1 GENE.c13069_g1_i1~~c13069_g1_i1.p1  ORF type:complete len:244 (-),score=42.02 c13069_g1_i1:78-767(-)